jgi:hypothetical protein
MGKGTGSRTGKGGWYESFKPQKVESVDYSGILADLIRRKALTKASQDDKHKINKKKGDPSNG